ncbi:hypothetical protein GQ600_25350 [Phytophthora cactorum]|nr:hypothetical protein GQ600_25350 [Phytophthora cactorum]
MSQHILPTVSTHSGGVMSFARCQPRPKRVRGQRQRLQDAQWRQRKKQEREQLKEIAQQLESQVEQLQQSRVDPGGKTASCPLHKKRKCFSSCTAAENIGRPG